MLTWTIVCQACGCERLTLTDKQRGNNVALPGACTNAIGRQGLECGCLGIVYRLTPEGKAHVTAWLDSEDPTRAYWRECVRCGGRCGTPGVINGVTTGRPGICLDCQAEEAQRGRMYGAGDPFREPIGVEAYRHKVDRLRGRIREREVIWGTREMPAEVADAARRDGEALSVAQRELAEVV